MGSEAIIGEQASRIQLAGPIIASDPLSCGAWMSQAFRDRLARRLAWQCAAHDPVRDPRNRLPQLSMLRQWQAKRLGESFKDFLANPRMRPAAEFFLSDLYGDRDFSARDRDAARVLPLMARLL